MLHQVAEAVTTQTSEASAAVFWIYAGFVAVVVAMLALDLCVVHRHAHEVRMR